MTTNFYTSIADYYEEIFPPSPAQHTFVKLQMPDHPKTRALLDIGCGCGGLLLGLTDEFPLLAGIDPDTRMLERAKTNLDGSTRRVILEPLGMEDFAPKFEEPSFSMITCLGNTLVHLHDRDKVQKFLHDTYTMLPQGGKLILQIINYQRILEHNIKSLPTIETPHLKFLRNYQYSTGSEHIQFYTILHNKETGKVIENSIPLLPILPDELEGMLRQAAYSNIDRYGGFDARAWTVDAQPCIMVSEK